MEYGRGQNYDQNYDQNSGRQFGQDGGQGYAQYMGSQGNQANQGNYGNGGSIEGGSYWRPEPGAERRSFRGQGPKGYARSDERLKEMICEKLTDDDHIDASEITVEVSNWMLRSGSVRSPDEPGRGTVERCGGRKDIHNQLRIEREEPQIGSRRKSRSQEGASSCGNGYKRFAAALGRRIREAVTTWHPDRISGEGATCGFSRNKELRTKLKSSCWPARRRGPALADGSSWQRGSPLHYGQLTMSTSS